MTREEMINYIVDNCGFCDENDKEGLDQLSDERLQAWQEDIAVNLEAKAKADELEATVNSLKEEVEDLKAKAEEDDDDDDKPTGNALTPEQEADIAFAREIRQERRASNVDKIKKFLLANQKSDDLTDDDLSVMSDDQLAKLARTMTVPPTANYAGAAGSPRAQSQTTEFASFGTPEEYLEL